MSDVRGFYLHNTGRYCILHTGTKYKRVDKVSSGKWNQNSGGLVSSWIKVSAVELGAWDEDSFNLP